jgi:hypothetical protein
MYIGLRIDNSCPSVRREQAQISLLDEVARVLSRTSEPPRKSEIASLVRHDLVDEPAIDRTNDGHAVLV